MSRKLYLKDFQLFYLGTRHLLVALTKVKQFTVPFPKILVRDMTGISRRHFARVVNDFVDLKMVVDLEKHIKLDPSVVTQPDEKTDYIILIKFKTDVPKDLSQPSLNFMRAQVLA